jgi:hypothetical protein
MAQQLAKTSVVPGSEKPSEEPRDESEETLTERKYDIISEQAFSREQTRSEILDNRAIDAIENRELADREPLNPIVSENGVFDELDSAISPQADSPGDSEADANTEFMMGLSFRPEIEDPFEDDEDDDDLENFERTDKTIYAEEKSNSAGEIPSLEEDDGIIGKRIDSDAFVISTGRPSPRSDAGKPSSVN